MSQLTTHILDTSKGLPAPGVKVIVYGKEGDSWEEIGSGETNNDGRIPDLLDATIKLHGIYKLKFYTKEYFDFRNEKTFYPFVEIVFEIIDDKHYHVPLLLNPFGYSTYRGS